MTNQKKIDLERIPPSKGGQGGSGFYTFFDDSATFITSMAIVILVMVPFMGYRFFEFHTLFNIWLPITDDSTRTIASGLISSVMVVTTLLFMVNSKSLFTGNKLILFVVALTINLFFWNLPGAVGFPPHEGGGSASGGDGGFLNNFFGIEDFDRLLFSLFISLVIASMDYGFAHLFDRKWKSRNLEHDLSTIEQQVSCAKQELSLMEESFSRTFAKERELQAFIRQHTCPHCREVFPSPRSVNAHKANCLGQKHPLAKSNQNHKSQ